MIESTDSGIASLIAKALKSLDDFERNLLPSLGYTDALAYLEHWESSTTKTLAPIISKNDLVVFGKVWLEQRFELEPEQQLEYLIGKYRACLAKLVASAPDSKI